MPRTYVIDTKTVQAYVDDIPRHQQNHPVVQMLRDMLDETYASGYPENIHLVNHTSVISSTLWTEGHAKQTLLDNDSTILSTEIKT